MTDGKDLEVTKETMDSLAAKLDAFAEGLSDVERAVLGAVISGGVQAVATEVTAFGDKGHGTEIEVLSWSFGSALGDPIRQYSLVNAWPKKWAG